MSKKRINLKRLMKNKTYLQKINKIQKKNKSIQKKNKKKI